MKIKQVIPSNIEYIKFTSHMLYINDDAEQYIPFNMKSHIIRGDILSKLKILAYSYSVEDDFIMDYCCNCSTSFYTLYERYYNNIEIKFKDGTVITDKSDIPDVANDILMHLIYGLINKNK